MRRIGYLAGGSILAITLALGETSVAWAQAAPVEVEEVIVTGSLIAGTPEDAALPVDVISQEDLQKQGSPSTVDLIKSLSVSSGVLGDTNQFDPRAQGSEGSGSVNLRGLGAQRTLVLLNGRRLPPNPFGQAGAGIVDTNMIPQAAIGRVEILKDGAAATYGSDAIGGVVNFITRKNFQGVEISGSYRVIDGSDGDYTTSVAGGWANDRMNVLLTAGFQHRSELGTIDRSWANQDYFKNPEGGWSAGNSTAPFLPTFSPAPGVFAPAAGFQLDSGCAPLGGIVQPGALPACLLHYIPYDNIVEEEDRYQLYGEFNIDLTDDISFHFEALYGHTEVPEWNTSASYLALQSSTAATNPATGLPASVLAGYWVPSSNPGFALYRTQNPAQIPAFANGAHFPGVRYRPFGPGGNPAFGDGASIGERTYEEFRISGGLKGEWNGINWDFALTYGGEKGYRSGYDTVVSRFQMALRGYGQLEGGDACTAAETANFTTNAGNAALGCHWFNPFSNAVASNVISGQTNPNFNAAVANNPDLVRWFFQKTETEQETRLFVADLVFSGKTGISLPGGDIAWALGAQFRRNSFESTYNDLSNLEINPCIDTPFNGSTACTVRNGPFMFLGGGFEADLEADAHAFFGELALPVLDNVQVQLAARFEDYGDVVGSTFDPKISARWQVNDWIALRASAGSTFRGPPLTQLAPGSVTALSFIGGAFRAIDIFGNADLEPESANTYSAGVILDIGGLKATMDWWQFDFENPIIAEPSASIVNTMFPGGSTARCADPAFDTLETRFTFSGGVCGLTTISRVRTGYVNGPAVKTSGVDFLVDYDFGEVLGGDLRVGTSATYIAEYQVEDFLVEGVAVEAAFDAVGKLNYQLGPTSLPQWKSSTFLEYTYGWQNFRLTWNYIDSYVDQRTSILAPNPVNGAIITGGKKIESQTTVDFDYRAMLPWDATLVFSVDNLLDRDPSFARLDLNYDPFTGNALGRTFKFSLTKKF